MEREIGIYCRVSTKKQDTKSQIPALKRWAEFQNQRVRWYYDTFSGKTMDRPGWNKLYDAIRAGKVDTVVVWKLDRLGRTTLKLLSLFDEFKELGVKLISLTEGFDLSTPAGRKFARDLASAAEYEREVIGERIREGIATRREEKKRNGEVWSWGGSKKGVRKKVTPTQIKAIKRMKSDNETVVNIALALGLSRPTVYHVLANE